MACLFIFTAAACLAEPASKPACNAASRARFWPEEANGNPQLMRKLAQSGELEICAYGTWKYRWEPVTRSAQKSSHGQNRPPPSPTGPPIEDNVRRR